MAAETKSSPKQVVRHYEWRGVDVPKLETDWRPSLTLTVVMPAYNCQNKLDLTLAALAHQQYPSELFEVVVADDGSDEPLKVPDLAPKNVRVCRLERDSGWGRARACAAGAAVADGEILLFLDADMVAFPEHLAAHARWHHALADGVTLGHKWFVDFAGISAQDVDAAARDGRLFELVGDREYLPHDWVESLTERTNFLTTYRPELFTAAVGSTVAMPKDLYHEAGGFRTHLRAGEDMEFGYRLMTAGAVFIPEWNARSWHQGPATYMTRAAEVRRQNNPHFANFVPIPGRFRPWTPGRQYEVAMVDVIIPTIGEVFETAKNSVDAVLASDMEDLRVELCCALETKDVGLLTAQYAGDPRVTVRRDLPESGFPSRFTLFLPEWAGLHPESLSALIQLMEEELLGVIHVAVPGVAPRDGTVELWRTAALHRARRVSKAWGTLAAAAGETFGERWVGGEDFNIVDFRHANIAVPPSVQPSRAKLIADFSSLEATNFELTRRLEDVQLQRADLRRRNRVLRARVSRLRARLERANQQRHDEHAKIARENKELKQQRRQLRARNRDLREKLNRTRVRMERLRREYRTPTVKRVLLGAARRLGYRKEERAVEPSTHSVDRDGR